jgi:hypothetical protein
MRVVRAALDSLQVLHTITLQPHLITEKVLVLQLLTQRQRLIQQLKQQGLLGLQRMMISDLDKTPQEQLQKRNLWLGTQLILGSKNVSSGDQLFTRTEYLLLVVVRAQTLLALFQQLVQQRR